MKYKLNLLLVSWVGLLLISCSKHEPQTTQENKIELPRVKASVTQVVVEKSPSQVELSGLVRAKDSASIAAKVMGTISSFPVNLGQKIKSGDLLAKIDAAEIGAKVSQAETQLRQAQRDLHREQGLLAKEASTAETVRNLEDRVSMMEAMVREANAMLAYTEIRAPFDGVISKVFTDEGSLAAPGVPLLNLEGNSGFEIEAGIPESLMAGQSVGSRFMAKLPPGDVPFEVTTVEIASGSNDQSRTVKVRFSIPLEVQARTGQFARIILEGAQRTKMMVPASAVSKLGQMESIFVANKEHAELRLVKTGARSDEFVEILTGLDSDEWVVVNSADPLKDGQPLEVAQ
jgi:membrane fusion protein, multidrug efflux system